MLEHDTALIVDRLADVRQYIASILLRQLGCRRVLQAANCSQARAILDSGTEFINWIFYDWDLPDDTEPQRFLDELRQRPGCRDASILVTTRNYQRTTLDGVMQAGGTDYLIKPFTSSILLFKVRRISLSREHRANARVPIYPSQTVTIRFQPDREVTATVVSISPTGCLARAPGTVCSAARIYGIAQLTLQTADGELEINGELLRMETDHGPQPSREHVLLAFRLPPLGDREGKQLQRLIATLAPTLDSGCLILASDE